MKRGIGWAVVASSLFVAASASAQDAALAPDATAQERARTTPPVPPELDEVAQSWLAPAADRTRDVDVLKTAAFTSLLTGGAFAVVGAITWAASVSVDEQVCGKIAGCFERPDPDAQELRRVGTGFTGFGLGMALVSGAYLAFSSAFPLAEDVELRNERTATAGLLLLSLSSGLFAGGVLYAEQSDPRATSYDDGWPFFLAAAATGVAGVPLFAIGIRVQDDYDKARRRLDKVKRVRLKKKSEGDLSIGVAAGGFTLRGEL